MPLRNFPFDFPCPEYSGAEKPRLFFFAYLNKVLGFSPKRSIEIAIKDLCEAFKENKIINPFDNDLYFNVKRLQKIQAK